MSTINPTDPVSLGLCSQMDLDEIVRKAAEKKARMDAKAEKDASGTLKPVDETVPEPVAEPVQKAPTEHTLESLFKPSGEG